MEGPDPNAEGFPLASEAELVTEPDILLLRRVHPQFMKPDAQGGIRISKGAFQNSPGTDGMSVTLEDTVMAEGRAVASLLARYPGYGLVGLTSGFCISEEQRVERIPDLVEPEPAHGEVIGEKSQSRRKKFVLAAEWVVKPS